MKGQGTSENPWLIRVDGITYRWTIWADDDGLELRVLDNQRGGSLLVVQGLSYEADRADWTSAGDTSPRFTTLPENKVASWIREARQRGWRFDARDETFRL